MGIGTITPNPSAQLDVYDSVRGLLIPRVALTAANQPAPVTNPATGLLIFNTATAGVAPNNVVPGFYYWNGTRWYPSVNKGNATGDMQYWDGTKWISIPAGQHQQVLTWCHGRPQWGECPPDVVTISPSNNDYEGFVSSYNNSWNPTTQVVAGAWTINGSPANFRELIKFDLTTPPGAIVDSARLILYSDPTPDGGNKIDAQYGEYNGCDIKRITSPWTIPDQFSWNSQPATTELHKTMIPATVSISSNENCSVLVTDLVKDMISSGNNGFAISLQSEVTYKIRQYVGSRDPDTAKHPKLILYLHY